MKNQENVYSLFDKKIPTVSKKKIFLDKMSIAFGLKFSAVFFVVKHKMLKSKRESKVTKTGNFKLTTQTMTEANLRSLAYFLDESNERFYFKNSDHKKIIKILENIK